MLQIFVNSKDLGPVWSMGIKVLTTGPSHNFFFRKSSRVSCKNTF